jgi:hypothetical protein
MRLQGSCVIFQLIQMLRGPKPSVDAFSLQRHGTDWRVCGPQAKAAEGRLLLLDTLALPDGKTVRCSRGSLPFLGITR